jgi:hypothetical protein
MEIANEQPRSNAGRAVQVTVDNPIGNDEPETGEHDAWSNPTPATVGSGHVTDTGNASSDCR